LQFGLYLHRKGAITAEQLVAALEVQTRSLVRIGQLALEEGILSARDIFDVLRAQHKTPHIRFGELAIDMGLMSQQDLMRLLLIQTDRKLPLAEILVRQGVLTRRESTQLLDEFRSVHSHSRNGPTTTTLLRAPHVFSHERTSVDAGLAI
jgi:hypothetical protein